MQYKDNQLIEYKKNIFFRIKEFFKRIFFGKKEHKIEINNEEIIVPTLNEKFKENLIFKEDTEKQRLLNLKRKYDNGEVSKEDMTIEDIDCLIKLYDNETAILNADTKNRKNNIQKMLNELRKQKREDE